MNDHPTSEHNFLYMGASENAKVIAEICH